MEYCISYHMYVHFDLLAWSCGSSSVETCHGPWDDNCIGAQSFNDMQISSPRGTPLGLPGCSSTHINPVLGCSMSKWNIGHTNIPEYAMPWLKSTWSHRWATCQLSGRGKVFRLGALKVGHGWVTYRHGAVAPSKEQDHSWCPSRAPQRLRDVRDHGHFQCYERV